MDKSTSPTQWSIPRLTELSVTLDTAFNGGSGGDGTSGTQSPI